MRGYCDVRELSGNHCVCIENSYTFLKQTFIKWSAKIYDILCIDIRYMVVVLILTYATFCEVGIII